VLAWYSKEDNIEQQLHEALGTDLKFSSAYHPQTHGQT
jgi:hypothetical protein